MKNRGIAIVLALFLGGIGAHKFYLGKITQGFLYLIFSWTFVPALLSWIDIFNFAVMGEDKFHAHYSK